MDLSMLNMNTSAPEVQYLLPAGDVTGGSDVLSVLLQNLAWHILVVISDGDRIPYWKETFNSTQKVIVYSVDAANSTDVDWVLDRECSQSEDSVTFVIHCSMICVKEVLYKVNTHDGYYNEQGVLTFQHRWLVLADAEDIRLDDIQNYVINITHLSVVYADARSQSYKVSHGIISKNYTSMWFKCYVLHGRLSRGAWEPRVAWEPIHTRRQASVDRLPGNSRHRVTIDHGTGDVYACMWKPEGRRFELSAKVLNETVVGDIFPNLPYGLNGRTFLVSTKIWGPFTRFDSSKRGNDRYSGFCIELVKAVAEAMNFTYIFIEAPDNEWGALTENGTWTGLIGELAYKNTDMMSAAASIQVFREKVMDGSFPFYIEETGILYRHHPSFVSRGLLFIRPFRWQVWLCMMALVLTSAVVVYFMGHAMGRFIYHKSTSASALSLYDTMWMTFGFGINQSCRFIPWNPAVRAVVIFWIFTAVIFSATFSSNLVALLTVDIERAPFNSLEELAAQQQYKFGVQGGTAYVSILSGSPGVYNTMWRRMVEWDDANYPVLSTSHEEHMRFVDEGGYAYFTDLTEAEIRAQTRCDLRIYSGNLFPLQFGMGFQNNSAYAGIASQIVMQLSQTGILAKWKLQFWPKATACSKSSSSSISIKTGDLSGLLIGAISLLVLSFGVFLIEAFLLYKSGNNKPKP